MNNHCNCIILPNYYEEEIALSQSQLCCNNNCNTSVNYDSILLLFFQHLILTSDLFSVFSPRFLDTLCWHNEKLNIEHSIDALPQGKNEISNYSCGHQELLNFQFQMMFIPYQSLLSSQK